MISGLTPPHTYVPVPSQKPVVQWLSFISLSFIVICSTFFGTDKTRNEIKTKRNGEKRNAIGRNEKKGNVKNKMK